MPSLASMKSVLAALVIGLVGLAGLPAASQQADVRMQGTIEKLDTRSLVLRRNDGTTSSISVDSETAVFTNHPSSLSAIKPGDYVASAAVKGADGKLRSKELRIFPEALRGIGEGQRPMGEPQTLMTNASVAEVVAAPEGQVVKVKYKDGTADLVVGPQVPITAVVTSEATALKSGTKVFIHTIKDVDGTFKAKRILTTK
jgi:Cu/Ag efflux protein CusF